jgi:hypothetical protein
MNEHILFVIDHLANPGKYTQEELEGNADTADAAYCAHTDDTNSDAAYRATYCASYRASYWAAYTDAAYAAFWVDEYFKITGEDKQTYIDALGE